MPPTRKQKRASSFFFNGYLEQVVFLGTNFIGRTLLVNYKQTFSFSTRTDLVHLVVDGS